MVRNSVYENKNLCRWGKQKDILYYNKQTEIAGLTTNPSLMRKSEVKIIKNSQSKF